LNPAKHMLHALQHGKLYGELKRHPRDMEDLLTSVVFGAGAYAGGGSAGGLSSCERPHPESGR
jgi:hypothetical protein